MPTETIEFIFQIEPNIQQAGAARIAEPDNQQTGAARLPEPETPDAEARPLRIRGETPDAEQASQSLRPSGARPHPQSDMQQAGAARLPEPDSQQTGAARLPEPEMPDAEARPLRIRGEMPDAEQASQSLRPSEARPHPQPDSQQAGAARLPEPETPDAEARPLRIRGETPDAEQASQSLRPSGARPHPQPDSQQVGAARLPEPDSQQTGAARLPEPETSHAQYRAWAPIETPRVRDRAIGSDAPASENESGGDGSPLRFMSSSATTERDVFSNENDDRQALAETGDWAAMLRARRAASGDKADGDYFHAAALGELNRNGAARALNNLPIPDATLAASAQRTEHIQSMVERFGDLIAGALTGKGQVMNIRLVPAALGSLSLRCREEHGRLSVEIAAETREARVFLTAHEAEIRTVVQNSGYRLTQFDVHAQGEDAGRRAFHHANQSGETRQSDRHERSAEQTETAMAPELLDDRMNEPGRLWWVA